MQWRRTHTASGEGRKVFASLSSASDAATAFSDSYRPRASALAWHTIGTNIKNPPKISLNVHEIDQLYVFLQQLNNLINKRDGSQMLLQTIWL